jgi:hypothetical protein
MPKCTFKTLLTIYLLTCTLHAASYPYAGKWKLDPSRSKLTDQMKVKAVGPNKYAFTFSGDNVETITADGTDQPALFGSTLAVTIASPDSWKVVRKTNGRITIIGDWKLSDHDSTLTDNFTSFKPDGSTNSLLHYTYKRTAGAAGFPGTWESVTEQVNSTFEIEIQPWQETGIAFLFPASQVNKSMNFDGKDYPGTGPNVPQGYTSSAHQINERSFQMTDKMNGKLFDTQNVEVSADGKTLTMTTTIPGQDKPNIQVFNRE